MELAVNAMDRLFALYNDYFDRLKQSALRLNGLYPNSSGLPLQRKSRQQFEEHLSSGIESESKRLFLMRVLNGNDELVPLLPKHLQSLARRAA
jgi:hypothetical protein